MESEENNIENNDNNEKEKNNIEENNNKEIKEDENDDDDEKERVDENNISKEDNIENNDNTEKEKNNDKEIKEDENNKDDEKEKVNENNIIKENISENNDNNEKEKNNDREIKQDDNNKDDEKERVNENNIIKEDNIENNDNNEKEKNNNNEIKEDENNKDNEKERVNENNIIKEDKIENNNEIKEDDNNKDNEKERVNENNIIKENISENNNKLNNNEISENKNNGNNEDDQKERVNEIVDNNENKNNIINEEINNNNNLNVINIINENEEEILNLIKYPYLGKSKNLIDYFLIVGFDSKFKLNNIIKVIDSNKIENSNSYSELKLSSKPKILNLIKSKSIKEDEMLNENEIINFSFPETTKIYYQTSQNQKFEPKKENIIFSYKEINNNKNDIYIGFTYSFYDLLLSQNKFNVYIPKAFIIISHYPFFNLFHNLCNEIFKQFTQQNLDIPMEVQLYNIINYVPAPVFDTLNLSIFPNYDINFYNINKNEQDILSKPLQKKIMLPHLTGFPYFDIDIRFILNIFSIDLLIKLFVYSFLEQKIIFFHNDLETLNFSMYILSAFSYPFDTKYFHKIISISKEDLINSNLDYFIIGVNCDYSEEIESKIKNLGAHLSVDVKNKKYKFIENGNENDILKIDNYISNYYQGLIDGSSLKKQKKSDFSFFDKSINNLIFKLYTYYEKVDALNQKMELNIFNDNDSIRISNIEIQEIFYEFILDFVSFYYSCFSLKEKNEIKKNESYVQIKLKDEISSLNELEKTFCGKFKETQKYNQIIDFIQKYKCIDIYKVPFYFFEEFICLKKLGNPKYLRNYFRIINNLYDKNAKNNNNNLVIQMNFFEFFRFYKNNLSIKLYDIEELKNSQIMITMLRKISKETVFKFKYKCIELDNNFMNKYINLLNNVDEDEKKNNLFKTYYEIVDKKYEVLSSLDVANAFENYFIYYKMIDFRDLMKIIIIQIICLKAEVFTIDNFSNNIIELLSSIDFSLRKYIDIILQIYYHIIKTKNLEKDIDFMLKTKINYSLFEFLTIRGILPNKFLSILMDKLYKIELKSDEEKKEIEPSKLFKYIHEILYKDDLYKIELKDNKNNKIDKIDEILKLTDNLGYEGNINDDLIHIYFNTKNLKNITELTSELFSPLKLYNETNKLLSNYIQDFNYSGIDQKLLQKIILNVIFYVNYKVKILKGVSKFLFLLLDEP